MSREILIWFGALFLTILLLNTVSAADMCSFQLNSADCVGTSGGQVVMDLSSSTNAHGALAGQGTFIPILCCNFGEGDTSCTGDNKILGLSSSTNAHAEAPDLASPNYNIDVCYDSLKDCSSVDVGFNCGVGEIEVVYISSNEAQLYTNAHIEEAGLASQNYDTKICCFVDKPEICDLTSANWQYEEVIQGTDVETIVNGTGCGEGEEISFEVYRRKAGTDELCSSIAGCENPSNVVFGPGSNSVTGTWTAAPYHDNEYYFVAEVVANPDETVTSSAPDLLVLAGCPYDPEPVICSGYTDEDHCNSNICEIDVQNSVPSYIDCDDSNINCECVWNSTESECRASMIIEGGICGDDVINPGETCDDSDWGSIVDCNDFDEFTGGTLECYSPETLNECMFDTTQCTGPPPGVCGDDVINPGETCDGSSSSDWLPITGCRDFDLFTRGTLMCTDCQFDTSECTGGPGDSDIGTCIYTQSTEDNCDDGRLKFDWTAEWTWDAGCGLTCQSDNQALAAECVGGSTEVICPAQIPLPFFNVYSLVATMIIIVMVYFILSKKEKRKR